MVGRPPPGPDSGRAYLRQARLFPEMHGEWRGPLKEIDLRAHVVRLVRERDYARSTVDQHVSARVFLGRRVMGCEVDRSRLPLPRRRPRLPVVLSRKEVRRRFDALSGPRKRAFCQMIYGTGLRLGEARRLRPEDLDTSRGLLRVQTTEIYTHISREKLAKIRSPLDELLAEVGDG